MAMTLKTVASNWIPVFLNQPTSLGISRTTIIRLKKGHYDLQLDLICCEEYFKRCLIINWYSNIMHCFELNIHMWPQRINFPTKWIYWQKCYMHCLHKSLITLTKSTHTKVLSTKGEISNTTLFSHLFSMIWPKYCNMILMKPSLDLISKLSLDIETTTWEL